MKLRRAAWGLTWFSLGYFGPRFLSSWRVFLLRLFGASIGRRVLVCGRVKVLMPWNLAVGDTVAIAERVDIYNFARVEIGASTCISQGVWFCTGTHDYEAAGFPLIWRSIVVGPGVWIGAEAFLHPGVSVGEGAVVGARSVVAAAVEPWTVNGGNPCQLIRNRIDRRSRADSVWQK